MSQENVEIVRRYVPAYERGGLDALAEFWHPDITWRAAEGALDDVGLMEGPGALRHYYEQWEDTFESGRMEVEELVDAGDQVVAVVRAIGADEGERGRGRPPLRDRSLSSRRQDRRGARVLHPRGSPQSRRARGVGDVAGERGRRPPPNVCERAVYWITTTDSLVGTTRTDTIGRANLDGTSVDPVFIPVIPGMPELTGAIAVDAEHIYRTQILWGSAPREPPSPGSAAPTSTARGSRASSPSP